MRCRLLPTEVPSPDFAGWVGDHEHAAGLERREELAVHLGAVDRHVGGVVVEE
jgi:hypothetical protein